MTNGSPADIIEAVKKRGNAVTHTVSLVLITALTGSTFTDFGIATRGYVDDVVDVVMGDFEDEVAENGRKIDRLYRVALVEQMNKILRFKCMNPGNSTMDQTLTNLENDYLDETGQQYQRPSCEFLIDSG